MSQAQNVIYSFFYFISFSFFVCFVFLVFLFLFFLDFLLILFSYFARPFRFENASFVVLLSSAFSSRRARKIQAWPKKCLLNLMTARLLAKSVSTSLFFFPEPQLMALCFLYLFFLVLLWAAAHWEQRP